MEKGLVIEEYVPFGHKNAIKRRDLRDLLGTTDLDMRIAIAQASHRGKVICNVGDGAGYFRPTEEDIPILLKCRDIEKKRALSVMHRTKMIQTAIDDIGRGVWKDSSN